MIIRKEVDACGIANQAFDPVALNVPLSSMSYYVRLFVLPVFRRHYLFYSSVSESTQVLQKSTQSTQKSTGSRLQRQTDRLVDRAQRTVSHKKLRSEMNSGCSVQETTVSGMD